MLWCASSSNSYIFDLKGLSMLHVEFSRIRTLRCSLVHNMFKRGCLWEQPLWKGRKEAELSEGRSQAVMQPKKLQLTPQEALDYTGGQSCPILGQSNKAFISCLNSHCMCLLWEGHDLSKVTLCSWGNHWRNWQLASVCLQHCLQLSNKDPEEECGWTIPMSTKPHPCCPNAKW